MKKDLEDSDVIIILRAFRSLKKNIFFNFPFIFALCGGTGSCGQAKTRQDIAIIEKGARVPVNVPYFYLTLILNTQHAPCS